MNLAFTIFFLLVGMSACQNIPYKADFGFMNSAQANSPEYLARINGAVCKDMDGIIGLCAKRVKSKEDIVLDLEKRPYAYRLNVNCSSGANFSLSVDVESSKPYGFKIPHENFATLKTFTCQGEVFPHDREGEVSAFWHVRFVVYDQGYRSREEVTIEDEDLVLGAHARYSTVDGKFFSKKTTVTAKGVSRAWTESELMRMNYYGH